MEKVYLQWCDEFYNMDWGVKKGAERLGKLVLEENTKIAYDKEMGKRTSVGSGRRPDVDGVEKFISYRRRGLSYREIQKIMGKDLKTLYRWDQFVKTGKVKLSTVDKE